MYLVYYYPQLAKSVSLFVYFINPRHMREGYGSSVCECVCVSVTALAVTFLIYTLKTRYH